MKNRRLRASLFPRLFFSIILFIVGTVAHAVNPFANYDQFQEDEWVGNNEGPSDDLSTALDEMGQREANSLHYYKLRSAAGDIWYALRTKLSTEDRDQLDKKMESWMLMGEQGVESEKGYNKLAELIEFLQLLEGKIEDEAYQIQVQHDRYARTQAFDRALDIRLRNSKSNSTSYFFHRASFVSPTYLSRLDGQFIPPVKRQNVTTTTDGMWNCGGTISGFCI